MYARITIWDEKSAPQHIINALMYYSTTAYVDYDNGLDSPVAVYYLKNPVWKTVEVFTAALTEAEVEYAVGITETVSLFE